MATTKTMKRRVQEVPLLGPIAANISRITKTRLFPGSENYWERRYEGGGTSGSGSEGTLAKFKSELLNTFVKRNRVTSVIEFGCGDGRQLELAEYPRYMGLDVSKTGVHQAMARFSEDTTKSFLRYEPRNFHDPANFLKADLALSLDVIYHLVEDDLYELHLYHLFGSAHRFVALYTSDSETFTPNEHVPPHVRHRPVRRDVADRFHGWQLRETVKNPSPHLGGSGTNTSFADFFIYENVSQ